MSMRTIQYIFPLFAILLVLTYSCNKEKQPVDFHYDYFGMEEGRYIIYDVIEIIHDDDLNQHDTLAYQLKCYWADTFVDNEGRIGREYWRYRRDSVTGPWLLVDVWHGVFDGIRGELVEDNQRIVRMVFAPTISKQWDANAYNTLGEMDCYYRDIHQDTIVGGVSFDSTVVVEQAYDPPNLIDFDRRYETYANNIGLIHRHWRTINTQFDGQGQPYINYGYELYYDFVETGFE